MINFLKRINAWGTRNMVWIIMLLFMGFLLWLFSPPSNLTYIIRADNGQTYHCTRYEVDKLPATKFSVDDKGAITVVLTPTYTLRLYDWKPHHWFRVQTAEFSCKHYEVNAVTDHDSSKP